MSYVQIREIIKPAEEGVTQPYFCSDKSGNHYLVKSLEGMPPRELVSEWVCAWLAIAFGLPCGPPCIMCDFGMMFELGGYGTWQHEHDLAFASPEVVGAMELNYAQAEKLDESFKRHLFVFDYWIQNADRVLSDVGGRVNLLFDGSSSLPVVIDHNQAFDPRFSAKNFSYKHIFGYDNRPAFQLDLVHREELEQLMAQTLLSLDAIVGDMPQEWRDAANEQLSGKDIIDDVIRPILERYTKPEFWQDVEP